MSRGCEWEHLEYSGTKVFMNGPIVCKLCVGESGDRYIDRSLMMNSRFLAVTEQVYRCVCLLVDRFKILE